MYSIDFYTLLENVNKDFYDADIYLMSVHPYDIINNKEQVMTEAIDWKMKKYIAINNLIATINKAIESFKQMTYKLGIRNKELIKKYGSINISKVNTKDFEYEIFPYWEGIRNIRSMQMPNFSDSDIPLLITNNGQEYKKAKFNNNIFLEDGSVNSNYFRGGEKKEKITGGNVAKAFSNCFNIINRRKEDTNFIINQCNAITSIGRSLKNIKTDVQETTTESSIFDGSIYKDEYLDILFEDAVTTTSEIEREGKDNENKINVNANENKESKSNDNKITAIKNYITICYSINAKMMSVLDEAYDNSIKLCERISNL